MQKKKKQKEEEKKITKQQASECNVRIYRIRCCPVWSIQIWLVANAEFSIIICKHEFAATAAVTAQKIPKMKEWNNNVIRYVYWTKIEISHNAKKYISPIWKSTYRKEPKWKRHLLPYFEYLEKQVYHSFTFGNTFNFWYLPPSQSLFPSICSFDSHLFAYIALGRTEIIFDMFRFSCSLSTKSNQHLAASTNI